ncbi:MAG: TlpA family protein disulfide reductase [Gemmatimonadota bacterium]
MGRTVFHVLIAMLAVTACQPPDRAGQILEESAAAIAAVRNGTYRYEYEGTGSLAGSYSGRVSFERPAGGGFFFKARLTPSPTPIEPGVEWTDGLPTLTIASNGREVTARDGTTSRFSFGTYAGGSGHLASSAGYAVLFQFAESDPFKVELSGELTYVGLETIDGVECEVVGATSPAFGGAEVTWYIGVEDRLPRGRDWVATLPGAEGSFTFRVSELAIDTALGPEALGNMSDLGDELVDEDARDVGVGARAPEWTLSGPSGEPVSSGAFLGEVTVLTIWSTWCQSCWEAMPAIDEVVRSFEGEPVRLLGVNAWEDRDASPETFVSGRGMSFEVLIRGERVAAEYKVGVPPAVFVLDADGTIVFAQNPITSSPADLTRELEAAIRAAIP